MRLDQRKVPSVGALVTEGVPIQAGCLNHQLQSWALLGDF
jgi:hypothetical protein